MQNVEVMAIFMSGSWPKICMENDEKMSSFLVPGRSSLFTWLPVISAWWCIPYSRKQAPFSMIPACVEKVKPTYAYHLPTQQIHFSERILNRTERFSWWIWKDKKPNMQELRTHFYLRPFPSSTNSLYISTMHYFSTRNVFPSCGWIFC